MTRKKFVKQLMAQGHQRNEANFLAALARWHGVSYEQYLQTVKSQDALHSAVVQFKATLADCLSPVCEEARKAVERLREALAGIEWKPRAALAWVTDNVAEDPLPQWPKENPHRCDAMDAMAYSVQAMSRADHDALHGRVCGIDLAAGPDMTALGGGGND